MPYFRVQCESEPTLAYLVVCTHFRKCIIFHCGLAYRQVKIITGSQVRAKHATKEKTLASAFNPWLHRKPLNPPPIVGDASSTC